MLKIKCLFCANFPALTSANLCKVKVKVKVKKTNRVNNNEKVTRFERCKKEELYRSVKRK